MLGMLQWRNDLEIPTSALENAVAAARNAHTVLEEMVSRDQHPFLWKFFDFAPGAYVSGILRCSVDPEIVSWTCHWSGWKALAWQQQGRFCERFLDAGVLSAIQTGRKPEGWDEFLAQVQAKVKVKLLSDTYATYMNIVLHSRKGQAGEAVACVAQAAQHYRKRARNSYFGGGPDTFGGEMYNEHVVDFVLACLIRCCLPDRGASLTGDAAIHVWRW